MTLFYKASPSRVVINLTILPMRVSTLLCVYQFAALWLILKVCVITQNKEK